MNYLQSGMSMDFGSFLKKPITAHGLDLSEASLVECLEAKMQFHLRRNPKCQSQYFSSIKILKQMDNDYNCRTETLRVDEEFWTYFIPYMFMTGLAASSIKTIIAVILSSLKWGGRYGAKISETYNLVYAPKVTKQQVALLADDVSRIYHKDIDALPCRSQHRRTLERVKDMLCLLCNTGLRYSDARRLCKDHFHGEILEILQQKTKVHARIDLRRLSIHPQMVFDILKKYDYKAPYDHDLTEFDKLVHELMMYCGYDKEVVTQETVVDGEVTMKTYTKDRMITSHTGRRTFIVYNLLRGVPYTDVMRASGHTSFEAFRKYFHYND